jgi:hypothetical protein
MKVSTSTVMVAGTGVMLFFGAVYFLLYLQHYCKKKEREELAKRRRNANRGLQPLSMVEEYFAAQYYELASQLQAQRKTNLLHLKEAQDVVLDERLKELTADGIDDHLVPTNPSLMLSLKADETEKHIAVTAAEQNMKNPFRRLLPDRRSLLPDPEEEEGNTNTDRGGSKESAETGDDETPKGGGGVRRRVKDTE